MEGEKLHRYIDSQERDSTGDGTTDSLLRLEGWGRAVAADEP